MDTQTNPWLPWEMCAELDARMNLMCRDARHVTDECYGGLGDANHVDEIVRANDAANTCLELMNQECI